MAAAGSSSSSSRFAVTCGLLRQYMMEQQQQQQQQLGGLDGALLRLPPLVEAEKAEETDDGRTMQLFPTRAGTLLPSQDHRPEAQTKAPLTIFYEGRVVVIEDFPADKAEELMKLAVGSSGSSLEPKKVVPEKPASGEPSPARALSDLPIARKASLQRFLQKRKHRINAAEPYNKATASPVAEKDVAGSGKPAIHEPAAAASWLRL